MSFKARHAHRAVVAGAAYDIFQGGGISELLCAFFLLPLVKMLPGLDYFTMECNLCVCQNQSQVLGENVLQYLRF